MSTTESVSHLTRGAREQLTLSDGDRIKAIYGARFVPHPNAKRVLDRLNFLVGYPKCARMQCLLLYGDSGMGKTMVVETDARIAIQTDLQVASRFEPCHLPRWGATEAFRGFLTSFLKGLPLHEPSEITGREAVHLLLLRSSGITGRITLILARAAEMAIRKGTETINAQWLDLASRDLDLSPPLLA